MDRSSISRRDFIRTGTLGVVGLSLADGLAMPAAHAAWQPAARSVILLWMHGGPPSHETFDPKPRAPLEIRGAFGAIPSNVPGIQVGELMPRMAMQMEKVALIRTLTHDQITHEGARDTMLGGLRVEGGKDVFTTEITEGTERESVLDAYGRTAVGEQCLRARRLVERGARVVTVIQGGWDTHSGHFAACERDLIPPMDRAFAALLQDLHDRGLLSTTLVVWMGEFGRSPEVNAMAGRDHWPRAACAVLAGAGIRGGQVIGQTDAWGAEPTERAISPPDLARTISYKLGLDSGHAPGGNVIQELT